MDKPPDVNKGPAILIACCICVACAVVMVALRAFVRLRMFKMGGWDDICIAAAMTVMLVELAVIIPSVSLGAGRHVQYLDPKNNIQGLHLNFVTQPLCLIALCLTKLSVGLFLIRLTPSKRHVRIVWAVVILTVLSWLGNFLTVLLQCQPLRKVWDLSQPGKCIPPDQLKIAAFFNSSVSALTDLIFALLPIPLVRRLQMNRRTKVAIIAILSLGIFVTVCAIIKMSYLGSYGEHGDFLFDSSEITIWTTVEICTAIVAACAPCLRPLFRELLHISTTSPSKIECASSHNYRSESRERVVSCTDSLGHFDHQNQISDGEREDSLSPDAEERIVSQHEQSTISKSVVISVKRKRPQKPPIVRSKVRSSRH